MVKRLLTVDDNEDLLSLLTDCLEDQGYSVLSCDRSREAYARAKSTRPDLILLDVHMPIMSGWEVLNLFLLDRRLQTIPIVLMTLAPANALKRLHTVGALNVSILAKPFSLDRLLEHVEEALVHLSEGEMLFNGTDGRIALCEPPVRQQDHE